MNMKRWFQKIGEDNSPFILQEMAKKYGLSKQEYFNLVDTSLYYFIITDGSQFLDNATFMCNKILENRELIAKNQNHAFFQECLFHFLEEAEKMDPTFSKLQSFLDEKIVFHSFNAAFFPKINQDGLQLKEKPWDLGAIEQIRKIFMKKNHKNIFGMYQGRMETPIFFANTLISSPYYGLSSPTFFRKFIEHNPRYFNVFLLRDYPKACESIQELCEGLSEEDAKTVYSFFQKYWKEFTTEDSPYIAISTQQKLGISETPVSYEGLSLKEYYIRLLTASHNSMIHQNIPREDLEIFSYDTLTFMPAKIKKID